MAIRLCQGSISCVLQACMVRNKLLPLQDADDLYGSAISKLRAVLTSDPGSQAAERACGLALLDRGSLEGTDAGKLVSHSVAAAGLHVCPMRMMLGLMSGAWKVHVLELNL